MKKLLVSLSSFVLSMAAHAQGVVDFNNFGSWSEGGGVFNVLTGMRVDAGAGVVAQLYWAPTRNGSFAPTGVPVLVGELGPGLEGTISGGLTTIEGTNPGRVVYLWVVAWESAYGPSFCEAMAASPMGGRSPLLGSSGAFASATGSQEMPVDLGPVMPTFSMGVPAGSGAAALCVPEPSLALVFLLGLALVLQWGRPR